MKGKKKRFLSSVCAVFMALLMIAQTVGGSVVDAAATKRLYGEDGWLSSQMITGVKVDKDVYIVGKDTKVVVTFDVRKAADADDPHYNEKLLFQLQTAKDSYFLDRTTIAEKEISIRDLKAGENKVEIPYSFPTEEEEVRLFISQYESLDYPDIEVSFSVKKQSSDGGTVVGNTDYWSVNEQVSNVKTDKSAYELGSEQTITVSYNVAKLPKKDCTQYNDTLCFIVATGSFDIQEFEMLHPEQSKGLIACQTVPVSKLTGGTNKVSLKARFTNKGVHYLYVMQDSFSIYDNVMPKVDITVKAPTDDSGNVINTKASIRPQYSVYAAKQAATMKVFYTIDDSNSKYHLYIRKGLSTNGYDKDQKYVVADFMTEQGDLPTQLGKELSVTLKKSESDFAYKGVYTAVLYNTTTKKQVAKQKFYVIPEKYVIQRDATKMTDDGTIPFYCDADLRNFDLSKDDKYSFQVCFPINYSNYMKELENYYDTYGTDEDLESGSKPMDISIEDAFLTDDYSVNMTVSYVPEGSKDSRKLFRKTIKGMYKAHTVTLSSKEILKAIYDTGKTDIAYAGVVTVKFSNEDDYQMIANEAIISFTESFRFGVSKAESLTGAEAAESKVELAYGERATFNVKDTLGGKIYADIYKGNKKINSVEGACQIKSDYTAAGSVDWNLSDSSENYVDEGEYTAKVYTVNEYTVFENDGSTSQKKIKSEEKSITFSIVKPNRSLTLSTSVSGDSGGNAVYVEKPVIGVIIKANIGVSVQISVKNSKGIELRNASGICRRGQRCISLNLSGSRIKAGKYKVVVTAETMDGQTKTSTTDFHVRKLPKSSIQSASVSANSTSGLGTVSFKISEYANVTVTVKYGKKVMQTVIDQSYSAGAIKTSFPIGGYKPGKYSLVIKTKNSGGKRTVTKTFSVTKKPVIVKKPTASNLTLKFLTSKDGDMVQGTFSYTGKNAKVIIDIMYNDTEEIVYTYQSVTKNDSGTFSYIWDGFKSNGFRCWPGSYTYRVHLVNSAGSTPYLRQNFDLGAG